MTTINQPSVEAAAQENEVEESTNENLQSTLQEDFSQELKDLPHVALYVQKCRDRIKRQSKKITKLQKKILALKKVQCRELKKCFDSETQTSSWDENQSSLQGWNSCEKGQTVSVIDQVKEVAESALHQTGFVYEETSGLYYDYNTGYYYDAKLGLYYDGNSGTYYYYDEESKTYQIHSQPFAEAAVLQLEKLKRKTKRKSRKEAEGEFNKHKVSRSEDNCDDLEEGEYSESNDSRGSQDYSSDESAANESDYENGTDLAKTYPPCMRIVVKETNLSKLRLGTLFLVPYTGGSMGREGNHSVLIQDINISKHHARFQYNEEKKQYEIIDLGSRNGTILDNVRLSVAKQESDPHKVIHGSVLQVGSTKLLCHIHSGNQTCGNCEPGLLQCSSSTEEAPIPKMRQHKSELRRLKSKFGVESDNTVVASQVAVGYRDRAHARRVCVGSSDDHAKTQQSSLDASIAKDNKGFKLLSKMGWSEGRSLGKDGEGITEPVPLVQNHNKSGLGFPNADQIPSEVNSCSKKKQVLWIKTQKRYSEILN